MMSGMEPRVVVGLDVRFMHVKRHLSFTKWLIVHDARFEINLWRNRTVRSVIRQQRNCESTVTFNVRDFEAKIPQSVKADRRKRSIA